MLKPNLEGNLVLETRSCSGILGLFVLSAGALICLAWLLSISGLLDDSSGAYSVLGRTAFGLAGVLLMALGALLSRPRPSVTIDRRGRIRKHDTGETLAIDTQRPIRVDHRIRSDGDRPARAVYRVWLPLENAPDLDLLTTRKLVEARRCAGQVARLMDSPLVDASAGLPIERLETELDISWTQLLHKRGRRFPFPVPPSEMQTRVEPKYAGVHLHVPGKSWRALRLQVVVMLFAGLVLVAMLQPFVTWTSVDCVGLLVTAFVLGGAAVWFVGCARMFARATRRTEIEAGVRGLEIREKFPWRTRRIRIAADDLEDLVVASAPDNELLSLQGLMPVQGHYLLARSGDLTVKVGEYLHLDELLYLRAVILSALTGEAGRASGATTYLDVAPPETAPVSTARTERIGGRSKPQLSEDAGRHSSESKVRPDFFKGFRQMFAMCLLMGLVVIFAHLVGENRPQDPWTLWTLVGVATCLIGLGLWGLYHFNSRRLVRNRSVRDGSGRERSSDPTVDRQADGAGRHPLVLELRHSRIRQFVSMAAWAVSWNSFCAFFFYLLVIRSGWSLLPLLIIGPMMLLGLVMVVALVFQIGTFFSPVPTVSLSGRLTTGGSATLHWSFPGRTRSDRGLTVKLEGVEEARFLPPAKQTHVFYRETLWEAGSAGGFPRGSTTLSIPAGSLPSFHAPHNRILWRVRVEEASSIAEYEYLVPVDPPL